MVAVPRPTVLCTARLTSSCSCGPVSWADSKSMAACTGASPKALANRNPTTPATAPTIIPRMSSRRTDINRTGSVAREAEEVPAVVHELVHGLAGDHAQDALLDAHEIQEDRGEHAAERQPGRELPPADGDRDRGDGR